MPETWRKVENEKGFPYYINDATNSKQWDHPKFGEIKQRIDDCNCIKYSNYRVASKFRVLQNALYTEDVSLNIISGVFEKHRLGATESSLCLESYDVEAVLADIYFATNKQNHTNVDLDYATELMINFLYNVYDKDRLGKIQVSSTKLVLAVLSNSKLSEVYRFIFNLCADHNNCVTRIKLQTVLSKFAEIAVFMHEDVSFGQHLVNQAVDECFSNSPGLVGINENTFVSWLESNPILISWLPALSKLRSSESIIHGTRCTVCKATPLIGLKYRCNKCRKYIQCQRCFLTGVVSHTHKVSHSMKEYSAECGTKENPATLLKKLCKLMKCSKPVNESYRAHDEEIKSANYNKNLVVTSVKTEDTIRSGAPITPYSQLHLIIRQLELQNTQLWHVLTLGKKSEKQMKSYLEEHRQLIEEQIAKLKSLQDDLKQNQMDTIKLNKVNPIESTPMVPNGRLSRAKDLDLLSPICLNEIRESKNNTTNDILRTVNTTQDTSMLPYTIDDISTWMGGHPQLSYSNDLLNEASCIDRKPLSGKYSPVREMHTELDEALAKLQQILANNFTLDESLGSFDNGQLKSAVTEVEGMLTSLIDTVENSRAASALHTPLPIGH